ncbi:MAG: ElyC/SanA/YdcF family protein [Verrucomicrobiales bacterium]|nr:ElyC/SanA/YdcF family protein [Verrucomicrobiales bacterium]
MANHRKRGCCLFICISPILAVLAVIVGCNLWVISSTDSRVTYSPDQIENQSVALVLGTSKKVAPNTPNPHFENRIAAAVELFEKGKVGKILVSGYRDSRYYDEARDMEKSLKERKIPESAILTDGKGNRTLDSIERTFSIHKLDRIVIVSDNFHVHRALFIADRRGVKAVALASKKVPFSQSYQTHLRELLARVKVVIDLYLINPEDTSEASSWVKKLLKKGTG